MDRDIYDYLLLDQPDFLYENDFDLKTLENDRVLLRARYIEELDDLITLLKNLFKTKQVRFEHHQEILSKWRKD